MKAVVIEKYGTIEELNIQQLPKPIPGPKDVVIKVRAAAVNPVDIAIRNGWLKGRISYNFPLVIGWDVAGVITEVGRNVTKFQVGDEVYSYPDLSRNGTYGEFVAVEDTFVARKPKNILFTEASSLPLVGICAYRALIDAGNIQNGDRVLILGGSGGVGSFAVQLAKSSGAHVTATTSTKNLEFVKDLGADEVLDYTNTNWGTIEGQFDLVFDTVGPDALTPVFDTVKKNGKIVSVATFFKEEDIKRAKEKEISVQFLISEPSGEILSEITNLIEKRAIKPVVGKIFSLEDVKQAHQLSESKHAQGKIVLQIS